MSNTVTELDGMKVLIVDDTPANIDLLRRVLTGKGFNISIATSGEIALQLAPKFQPDLILLDIMMSGIDGFETCQKLKENELTQDIPVIFLSAKVEPEDIIKGFSIGGVDYITKPYRQAEVVVRVETQLKLKKTSTDLKNAVLKLHDAQDDNLAKSEFMTRMSHELRTPMNAIIGFSDILLNDQEKLTPRHVRHIGFISDAGNHLNNLINDVLSFCDLETSEYKILSEKVALNPLLEESIVSIKTQAESRGIRIENNIVSDNKIYVRGEAKRIKQIFTNLLSNAVKFNSEKGTIVIGLNQSGNERAIFSIMDTGDGIPDENYEKIFAPLFRLKNHRDRVGGIGLGLTIVKKFVELMGGAIGVESKLGQGSCFKVEFQTIPVTVQ